MPISLEFTSGVDSGMRLQLRLFGGPCRFELGSAAVCGLSSAFASTACRAPEIGRQSFEVAIAAAFTLSIGRFLIFRHLWGNIGGPSRRS